MSYKIRKLYDAKKKRAVEMKDVDKEKFESSKIVEFKGNKYRIWKNNPNQKIVEGDYIHDRNVFSGKYEEMPIEIFKNVGGHLKVNEAFITHNLYEKYGSGHYKVFKFGGNPPKEDYFKNRFIEKIDAEEA